MQQRLKMDIQNTNNKPWEPRPPVLRSAASTAHSPSCPRRSRSWRSASGRRRSPRCGSWRGSGSGSLRSRPPRARRPAPRWWISGAVTEEHISHGVLVQVQMILVTEKLLTIMIHLPSLCRSSPSLAAMARNYWWLVSVSRVWVRAGQGWVSMDDWRYSALSHTTRASAAARSCTALLLLLPALTDWQ